MANTTKPAKPFSFKIYLNGPHDNLTETQFKRWQEELLNTIREDTNYSCLLTENWERKAVVNRGITTAQDG